MGTGTTVIVTFTGMPHTVPMQADTAYVFVLSKGQENVPVPVVAMLPNKAGAPDSGVTTHDVGEPVQLAVNTLD